MGQFESGSDEDPYGENEASTDEPLFEDIFKDFIDDTESSHDDYKEKMRKEAKEVNQLLKGSSISKMFRRIASIIHPDKELDPAKKEEKNLLMSSLIEAREQKDIVRIFSLYNKHVGEAPIDLIEGDFDKITELLKHQVLNLTIEHDEILYEDPVHLMFYDMFYAKNKQGVARKIKRHIKSLREATQNEQKLTSELRNLKVLKLYLRERYEDRAGFMTSFSFEGLPF